VSRRLRVYLLVGGLTIVLDQLTKLWARAALPTDPAGNGIPVPVIDNYFDWVLAYNTGSAFSMFAGTAGSRVFLSIIGVVAVVALTWMVIKGDDQQRGAIAALGLMAGGAVGNLIDRIASGKVTDFVLWRYHEHRWPVFNVADIALTVAVGLFLLTSFRRAPGAIPVVDAGNRGMGGPDAV
jgi:signal peptidase II